MNRRGARELTLHLIFAGEFTGLSGEQLLSMMVNEESFRSLCDEYALYDELPPESQHAYIAQAVTGVMAHIPELDTYIERYAVGWNVGRISRVCKCILRLSMYEMLYLDIPVAASANEAVEMAKAYDSEQAGTFVNGILGSFVAEELSKR